MAYSFNGTLQYITVGSAPVTAAPLTIAVHFKKTSTVPKNGIFLASAANSSLLCGIYFGASSSVRGYLQSVDIVDIPASGSYTTGAWGHACLTVASNTSRTIYRNGGNSISNADNKAFPTVDRVAIGSTFNGASSFDGEFAEVGIWSAALDPDEVASLADGFTCDKVRPQSLVFYAPLIRDLNDIRAGLALTNNNSATVADHPRVY